MSKQDFWFAGQRSAHFIQLVMEKCMIVLFGNHNGFLGLYSGVVQYKYIQDDLQFPVMLEKFSFSSCFVFSLLSEIILSHYLYWFHLGKSILYIYIYFF